MCYCKIAFNGIRYNFIIDQIIPDDGIDLDPSKIKRITRLVLNNTKTRI